MRLRHLVTAILAAGLLGALSCGDPVHDAEVNALGPEAPGAQPGPTHRPGQPCLVCHGGLGPGGQTFATAGTIYINGYTAGTTVYAPLAGGDVHLVDSTGSVFDAMTNSVGNFYVTSDQWNPVFPLGALPSDSGIAGSAQDISVNAAGAAESPTPMIGSMGRAGEYASCAYCHFDPPGPTSPGHVYFQ